MSDGLRALPRLHQLLRTVAASPEGLGFAELRRRLDQPVPATLSRLLKGLVAEELVIQLDGRYAAGPALRRLARLCLGRDRQALLDAHCQGLAAETAASAAYHEAAADGWTMVRLAKHEVEGGMHYAAVGQAQPILAHAQGIPVATATTAERRAALLARQEHDRDELAALIDRCEHSGVVVRGEALNANPLGATRIAAAVVLPDGGRGSLGVTLLGRPGAPWADVELDRLATTVRRRAGELAADLAAEEAT